MFRLGFNIGGRGESALDLDFLFVRLGLILPLWPLILAASWSYSGLYLGFICRGGGKSTFSFVLWFAGLRLFLAFWPFNLSAGLDSD